ncbi:hypothetical protein LCGC14_2573010 [marine sediment metagenome]|uniref:Uncharacterized protein n=1 Tax=marine sediment metagenome TaxID=412755 RepID=A0A0F9AGR5_9ZZZZ
MATYLKFDQFVEDQAEKVHDLGLDQITVALSNVAPVNGNSVLANITEISYANLSARDITTTSSLQTAGVYKLILTDLILTATGAVATFQFVVIYNNAPVTPLDPLIGRYDHGSAVTLANGETYTLDFDDAGGFITVT